MDKKEIMSVWAAFQEVQEKKHKKLDPVGKEDGDVDNDGDEDSSDEYLANRRKKVGSAMKKEGAEESAPYPSLDKKKRGKKGSNLEDAGGPAAKLKGEAVEIECPKCKGKGCDHCDDKGTHVKESYVNFVESLDNEALEEYVDWLMEEDQIDELSADLLNRAADKAKKKSDFHMKASNKRDSTNDRIAKKHGSTARHSGASDKAKSAQNRNFSKAGDQYDKSRVKGNQANKFSAAAKKKSATSEAWEMISSVFESRQLERLLSPQELAAIQEKMQPGDTGGKGEEFMSTSSPKEKKVMADHEAGSNKKYEDWEEVGEMDASKAGKAVKSQSPKRGGEDRQSEPMGKVKGS